MSEFGLNTLPPWEQLFKRVLWAQFGDVRGKRILDFGSGIGVTACHYAAQNEVIAVEPSAESVAKRWDEHPYRQIVGSTEALRQMPDNSFDVIFCHNVLEYVPDRAEILKEFHRLLKPDGFVSLVKHDRSGRVMQMVALLNEFEKAYALLDGEDGFAADHGTIRYYEDVTEGFRIKETYGIRTFWDLQQDQECHKAPAWQEKMIEMELRIAQIPQYRDIAFFHHLILAKKV